jgi:hypothetical protein
LIFATAIGSTTGKAAKTSIVGCTGFATEFALNKPAKSIAYNRIVKYFSVVLPRISSIIVAAASMVPAAGL